MEERSSLTESFEQQRAHLRGVAYRMLGSLSEADDAVQEAWIRLNRSDTRTVDNLRGWLTTVVARVCLDMLRARKARREEPLDPVTSGSAVSGTPGRDPEQEALLADSVGLALLVVLDTLTPPERLAFVLHDLFGVPFDEIARTVGRSPDAARQLASRARRRVRGAASVSEADLSRQRKLVSTFLAALRAGDVEGLVAILDPEFAVKADEFVAPAATRREVHGARAWAQQAINFSRALSRGTGIAQLALVNGEVGLIVAPRGRLFRVLRFTIAGGRIARMDVIGDPKALGRLDLAVLD